MWIFAYAFLLITSIFPIPTPAITVAEVKGFCKIGAYPTTENAEALNGAPSWGSFCSAGDQTIGNLTTSWFSAPSRIRIFFAGYPNGEGLSLTLVRSGDLKRLKLKLASVPTERWHPSEFAIPGDWQGRPVRLEAVDVSASHFGWFAFSAPIAISGGSWHWRDALMLGIRALWHFLLFVILGGIAPIIALRNGVKEPLLLALIGLAGLAADGYLTFWAWFVSPRFGHVFSFLVPILALTVGVWLGRRIPATDRKPLQTLTTALLLTFAASLVVLFTCFLYGGVDEPFLIAQSRMGSNLPPDNELPFQIADGLIGGRIPPPLGGDWKSSDRPPLQTGMYLAHIPYIVKPHTLDYTIISITLQCLWIFAFWVFLSAYCLDRVLISLILAICFFSGFIVWNSWFVWPKLLAAAYTLAGAAVLLAPDMKSIRDRPLGSALSAFLITFGLLAHGGTIFSLIALILLMLILRKLPNTRSCGAALAAAAIVYMPWFLYQKLVDPTGDRLLKWHLAGVTDFTKVSFAKLLVQNYRNLTFAQIVANKRANFDAVFGRDTELLKAFADTFRGIITGRPAGANLVAAGSNTVRALKGFFFFPELDFLILGFLAIVAGFFFVKFRNVAWRFSLITAAWVGLTILNWCLLMFLPSSTVLHQGSYAMLLLAYAACVSGAWALSPRFAILLGIVHILINFIYFGPLLHSHSSDELAEGTFWPGLLVFSMLSLIAVLCLLWRLVGDGKSGLPHREHEDVAERIPA